MHLQGKIRLWKLHTLKITITDKIKNRIKLSIGKKRKLEVNRKYSESEEGRSNQKNVTDLIRKLNKVKNLLFFYHDFFT